MPKIIDRTGEVYVFENGVNMEIIEYFNTKNMTVKFSDGTVIHNVVYSNFSRGQVKNLNTPSVFNIGFIGYGEFDFFIHNDIYRKWISMMSRCYSDYLHSNRGTYVGCSVIDEWCCFQNFAKWYVDNNVVGFHLDKDILIKGNKVYGPDTCCFVPIEINSLFTLRKNSRGSCKLGVYIKKGKFESSVSIGGVRVVLGRFKTEQEAFDVYKIEKEKYVKQVANRYKDEITDACYNSLMCWEVDVND